MGVETAPNAPPAKADAASFVTPIAVTHIDETQYKPQLEAKIAKLQKLFQEFNPPALEVFESPPSHYRMRAEFTVDHRDGQLRYVMFDSSGTSSISASAPPAPLPTTSDAAADGVAVVGGTTDDKAEASRGRKRPAGEDADDVQADGGDLKDAEASTSGAATEGGAATAAAVGSASGARGGGGGNGGGGGGGRRGGAQRLVVNSFPVASRQVNELMAAVREECGRCPELRNRLFQVNFHTALSGDSMVTLLYHRKLGPEWQAAAERLRDTLAATPTAAAAGRRPHVIGRARKQKLEQDAGFVLETLTVGGRTYVQKQVEGAFSQPNGAVCQHMLNWALDVTQPQARSGAQPAGKEEEAGEQQQQQAGRLEAGEDKQAGEQQQQLPEAGAEEGTAGRGAGAITACAGADAAVAVAAGQQQEEEGDGPQDDLLELYCGNGNFTVPLAQNFRRVVATEVAKSSVDAARHNLAANGVTNVFLARMASEEFAETMRQRGTRRRLEGLGPWEDLRLRTILVDPPRAGLDDFTVALLQEFDRIVYISCNPDTLAANLRTISATHTIRRFAAFDQFPYTHHLECGVWLTRK